MYISFEHYIRHLNDPYLNIIYYVFVNFDELFDEEISTNIAIDEYITYIANNNIPIEEIIEKSDPLLIDEIKI